MKKQPDIVGFFTCRVQQYEKVEGVGSYYQFR